MNEKEFLELSQARGYAAALEKFKAAIDLARKGLSQKKRLAGDSYFEHNLRVAAILIENKSDWSTIIAGLLHGCLEVEKEIEGKFGKEVLTLIKGIAEVKTIKSKNKQLEAEALRKVLLATVKDVRIIIVQLANKLDNMREISFLDKDKQKNIAEEVLEFYAPLAYRLGMEKVRTELEDLAFAVVNPKKYGEIVAYLHESREERQEDIAEVIEKITAAAEGIVIIKIKGRPKHVYSIYRKIVQRGVSLDQQFDLLGVRVIVPEIKDCYALLGKLHEHFNPLDGRLKDYIANPKPNLYRSIHTTVEFPGKKIVEVQIRTAEMDEFSEEGVAAHWRYKGLKSEELFEKRMSWLKGVLELQQHDGAKEFLEAAKVDVFGDNIHCYTPKGDAKELPRNSTVLDFAYAVHEEVGNQAIGAKVNGKFVPLKYALAMNDVVEVLTHKNQRPRRSWLKIVISAKSRQKIRKVLKEFEKLTPFFYRAPKPVVNEDQGVLVEAIDFPKAVCVFAKCCRPIPEEEIVGIVTKKRVISVHGNECRAALKEEERWVTVQWKQIFSQKIRFFVAAQERSGLLADVLHTIATVGFEVKEAKAKFVNQGEVECSFLVVPKDMDYLVEMIKRVKKVKGVRKVYFE